MFSYICSSCGAPAFSSANQPTVGPCPHCMGPLKLRPEPDSTPPAGRERAAPLALVK
jgi:hypothetical protein